MWKKRSFQKELIDLGPPHHTVKEYKDCLKHLGTMGKWPGGDRTTISAIRSFRNQPISILDVGCGGGAFTIKLALEFPQATVLGIDLNPEAIQFAQEQLQRMKHPPQNVSFECRTQTELSEPSKSFDVVVATLVTHHFTDNELIDFIHRSTKVARQRVIFNDLHRHPLPYYSFKAFSPLFFRNRLVQHDGPLSILRAFKKHEWNALLQQAGVDDYCIEWKWAFRWLVQINCNDKS